MPKDRDERAELTLRLNEALRRQIAEAARRNVRSLNSEIVYRLRTSLETDEAAA
jgi:hypothetical protein